MYLHGLTGCLGVQYIYLIRCDRVESCRFRTEAHLMRFSWWWWSINWFKHKLISFRTIPELFLPWTLILWWRIVFFIFYYRVKSSLNYIAGYCVEHCISLLEYRLIFVRWRVQYWATAMRGAISFHAAGIPMRMPIAYLRLLRQPCTGSGSLTHWSVGNNTVEPQQKCKVFIIQPNDSHAVRPRTIRNVNL